MWQLETKKILLIFCMILLVQTVVAQEDAMDHYISGEYYEYLGLFDEAEEEYESALELFQSNGDTAWAEQAQEALDRLGNIKESKSVNIVNIPSGWEFVAELKEGDSVTHYLRTQDLEFVSVTKVSTDLEAAEAYDLIFEMRSEEMGLMSEAGITCVEANTGPQQSIAGYHCEKENSFVFKGFFFAPKSKALYMVYATMKNENQQSFGTSLNELTPKSGGGGFLKWLIIIVVIAAIGFGIYKFKDKFSSLFFRLSSMIPSKKKGKRKKR